MEELELELKQEIIKVLNLDFHIETSADKGINSQSVYTRAA